MRLLSLLFIYNFVTCIVSVDNNGTGICSTSILGGTRSGPMFFTQLYSITYRCGFWNWKRCQRTGSRTVSRTIYINFYQLQYGCCQGYIMTNSSEACVLTTPGATPDTENDLSREASTSVEEHDSSDESLTTLPSFEDGSATALISTSILIIIFVAVCLAVAIVLATYFIRRKARQSPSSISLQPSDDNDYANGGTAVSSIANATYTGHDVGVSSYANEGPFASANLNVEIGTHLSASLTDDENIYVVPAKNEDALYSQLSEIKVFEISRPSVKVEKQIGSGQFGTVHKGLLLNGDTGEREVAIKTLKEGSKQEDRIKFLQEAAIMGQFKHPNVVTMYGMVTAGEPVLIVLELLSRRDLRKHLLSFRDKARDDHTLLSYCRQVASGMTYLSSKSFVHRDLAARNILVADFGLCKIADFGMSCDLTDESYYVSHGGMIPVKWTAPEALHFRKYSTASDVWSYGVLMYEIWSIGHKPFEKYANNQVLDCLDKGYRLPPPPGCPKNIYRLMMHCWHPATSERPTFMSIVQQLSLPDNKLLQWSEEDKCVHPEAAKLGADLLCAQELYKDLQNMYMQ